MRKFINLFFGIGTIMFAIVFPIILMMIPSFIDPLRRTNNSLRRYMLRITPIGTSMDDVLSVARNNPNWTVRFIDLDYGVVFFPSTTTPTRMSGEWASPENLIGNKSVQVHLGTRQAIFRSNITAFYAFDSDGNLIDIFVLREVDFI